MQRAGSFANANLHFHTLVPEGVWHELADGSVTFQDVELAVRIVRQVTRLLARRDADATGDDEVDALAQAHAEAVQPPLPHVEPRAPSPTPARHRCALVDGFSLAVDVADRAALERLARYLLRPLISADRLNRGSRRPRRVSLPATGSDRPHLVGH